MITASLLAAAGTVQAQNISNLVTSGGFEELNNPAPLTTTSDVGEWFTVNNNDTAITAASTPVNSGSRSCRWNWNQGQYWLAQTLGVQIESGRDYGVDLWHAIAGDSGRDDWDVMEFNVEVWTSTEVDGVYELAVGKDSIGSEDTTGAFSNYAGIFSADELALYEGDYMQLRIYKAIEAARYDLHIDDVQFGPVVTEAVVMTDPAELSMTFGEASAVLSGEVAVSYVEGVMAANVTITSISVVDQSNPGAFTNTTSLPLTLTSQAPASEVVTVEFDNTTAGLIGGQTATGTVEIVWNEVGSASNHITSVPISALFLEVNDSNILALFNHEFNNADSTLSGLVATITAGNRSGAQGSTDTTYGTLTGRAPEEGGGKTANDGAPTFFVEITNTNGFDITLESLHFDVGRMWPTAPNSLNIAITGDITNAPSIFAQTGFNLFNGGAGDYDDFDVDLTVLEDHILASSESATFEFTFGDTVVGDGVNVVVDNIALLGEGSAWGILYITNNRDGTVTLSWDTEGTLQSAASLNGAWSDVAGDPVSPTILPMDGTQEYYRLLY